MDGLALLCNLHADGPVTLRRLRNAGVRTLRDLERVPDATLSSWLGYSRAHRFVVEARQLAGRLAEAPLEPEESTGPGSAARASGAGLEAGTEPGFSSRTARSELQDKPLRAGAFTGLDPEICGRLSAQGVRTFAALVAEANLGLARRTGIPYPKLLELSLQAQRLLGERLEEPESGFGTRKTPPDAEQRPLHPGAIEGLETETCKRLSVQGVRTFEALVAQTSLDLARRAGIPFPKLLDLCARAQTLPLERIELQPEPPRRAPALDGLSIAPSARGARHSSPIARAWEAAPAGELSGRPEDPGIAGPFG